VHSIVIDHREKTSQLADGLSQDQAWSVTFRHLPRGDYLIDSRFLVKRKTLMDLCAAIKDGRLFRQTMRLAAATKAKRRNSKG